MWSFVVDVGGRVVVVASGTVVGGAVAGLVVGVVAGMATVESVVADPDEPCSAAPDE